MLTKYRSLKITMLSFVFAAMSLTAHCETIWFPYANVSQWGSSTQSQFWGNYYSPRYTRVDSPSDPNLIFNTANVFYSGTNNSYFDSVDNDASFSLFVHNPTNTSYTGSNSVIVEFFWGSGGKIDETDDYPGTSTKILDITPALTSITYDSDDNQFLLSLPHPQTALIGYTNFFNPPPSQSSLAVTIKITAIGELDTQLRCRNTGYTRDDDTINTTKAIPKMQLYTYNGVSEDDFTGSYHVSVLPHWREQHQKKNSATPDWATIVRFVNTHSSSDDITVDVRNADGTLVKSHTYTSVPSGGRIAFAPSQFFDSVGADTVATTGIKREGHLEIYGTAPAAVGISGRFAPLPTSFNTSDGYRRRACYTHVLPFEVAESVEL